MRRKFRLISAVCSVAALFLVTSPARADAIDGHWCFGAAKRLEIAGATIVTPGGNRIEGDYGRHDFGYTVPAGEAGAGARVDMDLMGDDDMRFWPAGRSTDPAQGGAQTWTRCAAPTS